MSPFGAYARYYDLFYADKDYDGETAYVASLLGRQPVQAPHILDLGCGTAAHAALLVRQGYSVHGVDRSEQMLESARARRATLDARLAQRLSLARGDVRFYRTDSQFDAVISLFHVFSYQVTDADLAAAFATASVHMKAGAPLIFDFWYGPSVLQQLPERRVKHWHLADMEVERTATPTLHRDRNIVLVDYTIAARRCDATAVDTVHERHEMRYFFPDELRHHANDAGLTWETAYEWLTLEPPQVRTWSAVAICRK